MDGESAESQGGPKMFIADDGHFLTPERIFLPYTAFLDIFLLRYLLVAPPSWPLNYCPAFTASVMRRSVRRARYMGELSQASHTRLPRHRPKQDAAVTFSPVC